MDLSLYLGTHYSSQNYYVVAQLFSQPLDAPAFFSCLVSVVFACLVHGVLCLLTSLVYRI